jgi:beta-glucanase (GH16 family)
VAAVDRAGNVSRPARVTVPAPAPVVAAPAAAPAQAAPAPAAPAGPSFAREAADVRMPVGDRPGWKQTFTDDFTRDVPLGQFPAAVSDKWGAYRDGWTDTTKRGTYAPSKVLSVSNGVLDYAVHTEAGVHLVGAPTPKLPNANPDFGQTYGRYAVRFRSDLLPGYKVAWLLWPDSRRWPGDGEIDFPEGDLDGRVCGYVHHQEGTSPGDQDAVCSGDSFQGWHTAVIEWTPAYVRFILDGATLRVTTSRLPTTSMHWVLQTETNLDGRPIADTTAGHVQIDWVAAWRPA